MEKMYQVIADENELKWFFDHVIQKPAVNESYSAVFVSRHKKLTDEELKTFGLTRKEGEYLAVQTFRRKSFKDALYQDEENNWTFDRFLQVLKRFNVDKGAYVTGTGEPLPEKTLAIIFYVNPCDDIKVIKAFVDEYMNVNQSIVTAMLNGKTTIDNLQSYQWFGRADSNIKHLKASCKGSKYWMDFDIDVPAWWKTNSFEEDTVNGKQTVSYFDRMKEIFDCYYGKGNYVIVNTSGGYHVLVRTSASKCNPHLVSETIDAYYKNGVKAGEEPYLDEKGNCKFECKLNNSQIPGLPLPGTFQYGKPVIVLNKEDFE